MIRDPSDGSVREKPEPSISKAPMTGVIPANPVLNTTTSGLQTSSQKPENLARLERSRKQLESYHKTGKFQ